MSLLELAIAASEHESALPFPPLVFAVISTAIFVALGFVVWSFRDVANRHSHKTDGPVGHGSDHH